MTFSQKPSRSSKNSFHWRSGDIQRLPFDVWLKLRAHRIGAHQTHGGMQIIFKEKEQVEIVAIGFSALKFHQHVHVAVLASLVAHGRAKQRQTLYAKTFDQFLLVCFEK